MQLGPQRVVHRQPPVARGPAEEGVVDAVEPAELLDRARVIVDAQVDQHIGEPGVATVALDDEEGGRLLAAAVAARGLGGGKAVEQPLRQRAARALEGLGERVDGLRGDEDVPLGGVAGAGAPACPVVAAGAGEARGASLGVDHPELTTVALVVRVGQSGDDGLRVQAVAQQCQPVRAVAGVRVRLRRDGARVRLSPGHDRPDGEELRLHRHTPLARVEVARDDRVRADRRLVLVQHKLTCGPRRPESA